MPENIEPPAIQDAESVQLQPISGAAVTSRLPESITLIPPMLTPTSQRTHQMRLRQIRRSTKRRRRSNRLLVVNMCLLGIFLLGIISPLGFSATYLIQGYLTVNTLSTHALDGIQQLESLRGLFSTQSATSNATGTATAQSKLLDPVRLHTARADLNAAHSDFQQVQNVLEHTTWLQSATGVIPQTQPYVRTANAATQIGLDVTTIGQHLVDVATQLSPRLQGNLLSTGNKPLLTQADLTLLTNTIDQALPLLKDIQVQAPQLSLDSLPISPATRTQITTYLAMLPQTITTLETISSMHNEIGWLLGIGQPRTFLVQPLDSAEIRGTGGFTGQYGELHIAGARVGNFSLQNIALVEYKDTNNTSLGRLVPEQYRSWWPFANWGVRDANLSPDFPTSARYEMQLYQDELGHPVDGVIQFTPVMIEHILEATGPITIPRYQETVTVQNLNAKLHYYQLSHDGIVKEKRIEHLTDDEQARKMFTSALAHALIDRARKASTSELLAMGKLLLQDLQTRDLQVYFNNPQIETFMARSHLTGTVDTNTQRDGLYIVQTNVSVNKATEFIKTHFSDTVQLDSKGDATHLLTMNFDYSQSGPVYGFDTYRDYLRIYVPTTAHLITGSGFDSGQALCGGPLAACPQQHAYPHDQLSCPAGQYDAGAANQMLNDPYAGEDHPLDVLGPPTNTNTDLAGRTMYGGYIVIPKGCRLTVTLSWSVPAPKAQQNSHGLAAYNLYVQRQAGTNPDFTLTIQAPTCQGNKTHKESHYSSNMAADALYTAAPLRCP
jgi:hypothetical protein